MTFLLGMVHDAESFIFRQNKSKSLQLIKLSLEWMGLKGLNR